MPLSAWVADVTVAGNGWQSNRDMLWLKALVWGEGGCRKQNSINTDLKDQHCFFRVDPMTFWPLRQHSSTCPLQWIHVYHIYLLTVSVRYLHLNSGGTAALGRWLLFSTCAAASSGKVFNCMAATIRRCFDNTVYLQTSLQPQSNPRFYLKNQ